MAPDNGDKAAFNASIILDIMTNVALVVGAASNLGFHVLTRLASVYKGKIYFTAEDASAGYSVQETLEHTADVQFVQMDVTYTKSIIRLRHHIQDLDERIELLINNTEYVLAEKKLSHAEKVRRTLSVNFYGYINFGKLIYPLLSENARVVNVSGPAGLLATIENEDIRRRISDPTLTEDELVAVMQEYEEAARKGREKTEGWGMSVNAVSKVSLNAVTFLQHRQWSKKGVVINCVNPGNMSSRDGRKTAKVYEEGAKAVLYLATEAPLSVKGNFVWSNYNVIEWNSDPYVEVTTV